MSIFVPPSLGGHSSDTIDKDKCKPCDKALTHLEEIDDDADQKGIGFVKISDQALAYEYGLEELPALVYYRKKIPIVYDGKAFET